MSGSTMAVQAAPLHEHRPDASPVVQPGRERPCVFLAVPSGHNVANLLRSSFLSTLVDGGLEVVVLTPFAGDRGFLEEFTREHVSFNTLRPWTPTVTERILESTLCERFLVQSGLRAVRLQRDRARMLEPWRGRAVLATAKSVIARAPIPRRALYSLAERLSHAPELDALFATKRPAMVITASAGFLTAEVPLIYAARRAGVPQMGVDLGWDNLVSKYHTIIPVDRLAVWNEDMRQQAVCYHGFSPDVVSVVGAVQFDRYFEDMPRRSRDTFLVDSGLDPARALVTIATAPHSMYPSTAWLIDSLSSAIASDAFGRPAQLLVRVHPRDDLSAYRHRDGRPHVRIEKPVAHLRGTPGTPEFDQFSATTADRQRLAATLACSDVLVNFASTTTIEACVFDTPVVNVGFDQQPGLPDAVSIRRYFQFEHYQPVLESGAAVVAGSPDELIAAVRRYLADRTADSTARRTLVERLCTFRDARSGQRLASVALEAVRAASTRRSA